MGKHHRQALAGKKGDLKTTEAERAAAVWINEQLRNNLQLSAVLRVCPMCLRINGCEEPGVCRAAKAKWTKELWTNELKTEWRKRYPDALVTPKFEGTGPDYAPVFARSKS